MGIKVFTGISRVVPRQQAIVTGDSIVRVTVSPNLSPTRRDAPVVSQVDILSHPVQIAEHKTLSSRSVVAPYSTIFDKFDLRAEPVYNFFVPDETMTSDQNVNGKKLDELPRYVMLKWRTAPKKVAKPIELPDKRIRRVSLPPRRNSVRSGITFSTVGTRVSVAKDIVANGYIAPATIRATVEAPQNLTTKRSIVSSFDEDDFLASGNGSSNELLTNVRAIESSQTVASSSGSVSAGQFVARRDVAAGSFMLSSANPSSPNISIVATTARNDTRLPSVANRLIGMLNVPVQRPQVPMRVNFVEPNIASTVSAIKLNGATRPEHVESIIGLAPLLPNFESITSMLPTIVGQQEAPSSDTSGNEGTEYIGYVIEKYVRDGSGTFVLIDEIHIDDIEQSSFVDAAVLYGGVYRYRMRAILRWTHAPNVNVSGYMSSVTPNGTFQTSKLAASKQTFFDSDWSRNWAYAAVLDLVPPPPPDEVNARSISSKRSVSISWKMPEDKQRDISGFVLLRRSCDENLVPTSEWSQVGPRQLPANGRYDDTGLSYSDEIAGNGYVYALQTTSLHDETSTLSDQIAVFLNREWQEIGERESILFSEAGVEPYMHGAYSVKPNRFEERETVARGSIAFCGRLGSGKSRFDDREYSLLLESLDTGETFVTDISLGYLDKVQSGGRPVKRQ